MAADTAPGVYLDEMRQAGMALPSDARLCYNLTSDEPMEFSHECVPDP